ncbi:hypothetical protein MSAN_00117800 [Mycena sanguinolenta]|uniref:Protein kinase domain-containing protein n=1 Tax=Mycena sanguinolenta TaxID=230812 RepID=A0A8H6ZGP1_9AGAR|nr:hypothetical protein MSAN_00117800 [Mycena sanguinolenta]
MKDQPNLNTGFTHSSTCDPGSAPGMFSHSQRFTVTGGTFTAITKNYVAPSLPSAFRMIPMGDIDLRYEIRMDERTGVAYFQRQRACVCRMYSAKARIDGRKSKVTVAIYQGNDAEEEWRQDIDKYMSIRHPNIVQICGAASSNGIHATLFNDDLIPVQEVLVCYEDSHFSTVYFYAQLNQDFTETFNYICSAFQRQFRIWDCTIWIRRSTGRLCAELIPAKDDLWLQWWSTESPAFPASPRKYCWSAGIETIGTVIDSLTLEHYHYICGWNLGQTRPFGLSASTTVKLGAVFHRFNDLFEDSVEIAFLLSVEAPCIHHWKNSGGHIGEVMPKGWTRFQSSDVLNNTVCISFSIFPGHWHTWLTQANHIFRRLNIMSNFENYAVAYAIRFYIDIWGPRRDPPTGFLFLCPEEDFRTSPSSLCLPARGAYWSLDPSGTDRLSSEDATRLGFPALELTTQAFEDHWDGSIYEGLRQLHQAKGFDPYSQEVARHLGLPLYQVSSQAEAPFAYVNSDGEGFDTDIDLDFNSAYIDDYEPEYPLNLACDDPDLAVNAEAVYHEDVHDPVGENCGSEHAEISNLKNLHMYTFPNANGLTGIAEYRPDVYAIVTSEFNITSATAERGSVVIWSLDLSCSGPPKARRAARIPQSTLTNGLSTVPGHPDLVLAADSFLGAAYEINVRTGAVRVLIQNAAMSPGSPPPALGINGLHVRAGQLYFTNSQLGTFSRVPLGGGAVEVLGAGAYDDFTFDSEGRAWVATNPGALTLYTRLKNGTWEKEIVVGDAAGSTMLKEPSSAAFGRDGGRETKILYVTTRTGQIVAVDTSGGYA